MSGATGTGHAGAVERRRDRREVGLRVAPAARGARHADDEIAAAGVTHAAGPFHRRADVHHGGVHRVRGQHGGEARRVVHAVLQREQARAGREVRGGAARGRFPCPATSRTPARGRRRPARRRSSSPRRRCAPRHRRAGRADRRARSPPRAPRDRSASPACRRARACRRSSSRPHRRRGRRHGAGSAATAAGKWRDRPSSARHVPAHGASRSRSHVPSACSV